jgi:hypothetical protein
MERNLKLKVRSKDGKELEVKGQISKEPKTR